MAMLADKRERANYVLQPRGKALYEDTNRFGTRMLEKMGWSAGKGLGANEDGQKEFIRIRHKNSTTGFGFQDRSDQWTKHEEQFDGLLKTLGGSEPNPAEDVVSVVTKLGKFSGESLEEKSKKSRARVHYKKFTKGKDLSQYSEKDLANIFGRKTLEKETPLAPLAFGVHGINESSNSATEEGEAKNFGITTITAGTSINDYFKSKMESIKAKRNAPQESNHDQVTSDLESEDKAVAKKKKKQKSKELNGEQDCNELFESSKIRPHDNIEVNRQTEERITDSDMIDSGSTTKKSKVRKSETQEPSDSQNLELAKKEKKKSKKKKVKENDGSDDPKNPYEDVENAKRQNDTANGYNAQERIVCSDSGDSTTKRHKRKRCKSETQEPSDSQSLKLAKSKQSKEQKVKENEGSDDPKNPYEDVENGKRQNDTANGYNAQGRIVGSDSGDSTTKRHKRKRCKSETQEPCDPHDVGLREPKKKKKDKKKLRYEENSNGGNAAENIQTEPLTILDDLDLSQNTKKKKRIAEKSEALGDNFTTTELLKTGDEEMNCEQNRKTEKKRKSKTNVEEGEKETNEMHQETLDGNKKNETKNEKEEIPKDDLELNSNTQANEYKINSFAALKFRNADLNGFPGSNIATINGYRLPKNLKLVVVERPQDMLNISKFCYEAIEKEKLREKQEKEAQKADETSQPKITTEEIKIKKEKKRRAKYSYRELIRKAKTRNVFDVI